MAKKPEAYSENDARRGDLKAEFDELIHDARLHKAEWEIDLREYYFFAAPHRARNINSNTPNTVKPLDAGEANTSFPCEMAMDFATNMLNTFTPESNPWAIREPGLNVPDNVREQIADQIAQEDAKIFKGIAASNFYAECATAFIPDLAAGTIAMWIDDPRPYAGIECQAIPIHELEISLGPTGHVDFRSFVQWTSYRKLKGAFPWIKEWPADIEKMIKDKPRMRVETHRAFWRDWTVTTDVVWKSVCVIDGKVLDDKVLKGDGSCPMIVARFNPCKEWAFGVGSGIMSLPDFRHMDELAAAKIMNCDISLRPPITIPDDNIVTFEEGVEAGKAYPIRTGSEDAVKNIYQATPPDVAIYDRSDVEQRIKRLHFLDYPDQLGKTPPSATQWLDQMTMAQRRIGTPGAVFWQEWCAAVFTRFNYLLAKRGYVTAIKHNGKQVSLTPVNPARKSADQQEVMQAARVMQIAAEAFPEEWKVAVDGGATIKNLVKKGGADGVIKFRSPDQIKAALPMLSQLAGGQPGNVPNAAAQSPDQPPAQPLGPPPPAPTQVQIRGHM